MMRTISYAPQSRRAGLPNHVIAWFIGALATCVIALAYAGSMWPMAMYRLVTDGLFLLAWLAAAIGWGSIAPLDWSSPRRTFSICTAAGLGLGFASILVLLLGLLGWFDAAMAWGWIVGGIVIGAARLWQAIRKSRNSPPVEASHWCWLWLAIVPFAAIAIVAALMPPGVMWGDEPNGYDVVEYHLQIPREWYEAGRIVPLQHNVFSYFPFNMEMHYLLAMHLRGGPWAGMYLAQLMHVAFAGLTIAAIYGAVRASGDAAAATIAGIAAATTPWLTLLAPVAYNECALLFFGALSIAWILEPLRSVRWLRTALLAGTFAGFACGAKLTGAPLILAGIPLSVVIVWIIHRAARAEIISPRRVVTALAVFVFAGLLCFAPWLTRNEIWAKNPVFPEAAEALGPAHFSETQVERWQRAHSPRFDQQSPLARLDAARRQLLFEASDEESAVERLRYSFVPILAIGLVAFVLTRSRLESQVLLALLCVVFIFWIGFTHLQSRFFVLAIPILALLIGQMPRIRFRNGSLVIIAIAAITGFAALHMRLMRALYYPNGEPWLVVLLGTESIDLLAGPAAQDVPSENHLALVGDAKAFLHTRPMAKLSYRTVFDVDAKTSNELIEKWSAGAPADAVMLIDPKELWRFSGTYWKIPPPPRSIDRRTEPFILKNPSTSPAIAR